METYVVDIVNDCDVATSVYVDAWDKVEAEEIAKEMFYNGELDITGHIHTIVAELA